MEQRFLLNHAVADHAKRNPEKTAVRFSGKQLTYGQLNRQANQLAHTLAQLGVRRGDRVGIYMNKNLNSAVAIYGILAAGAAYVPLDPFAPLERLNFVVNDCGIRVVITNETRREQVLEMAGQTGLTALVGIPADERFSLTCVAWEQVLEMPEAPLDWQTTEQDLAYILYTSGSTGTPKGIMHTHRSGLSFAEWAAATYQLQATDVISNHAPLHFDLSTFDFFASSVAGATTVIVPEAVTRLPASMAKFIADEKISIWYSVPFALIQMLQRGKLESRDLSALRWVLFAGEPFPTKHLREVMKKLPQARFSNLYGPTETNVCTFYNVPPLAEDSDEPIPIGVLCANEEDLVLDIDGNEVAPGEAGELLIRGGTVMKGYWGRPDLSERGFYRRKVFEYCEDIFYRTGDLVQKMPDGNYKFLGRKDRQIKTRGYRVELDEIEAILLAHEAVHEAATYPVPDVEGSSLIEAAVILKEAAQVSGEEIIAYLSNRLPTYAVPARVVIAPDFPRTSTGKINRRELQSQAIELQGER